MKKALVTLAGLILSTQGFAQSQPVAPDVHSRCAEDVRSLFTQGGTEEQFTKALREMHRCQSPCATDKDLDFLMSCENPRSAAELAGRLKGTQTGRGAPLGMDESLLVGAFGGCSLEQIREAQSRGLFDSVYQDPTGKYRRFTKFESEDAARDFKEPGRCVSAKDLSRTLANGPAPMKVKPRPKPPVKEATRGTVRVEGSLGASVDTGKMKVNGEDVQGVSQIGGHGELNVRIPLLTVASSEEKDSHSYLFSGIAIDPAIRASIAVPMEPSLGDLEPMVEDMNGAGSKDSKVERAMFRAGRLGFVIREKVGEDARKTNSKFEFLPIDFFNYEKNRVLSTESIGMRAGLARLEGTSSLGTEGSPIVGFMAEGGVNIGQNRIHDWETPVLPFVNVSGLIGKDMSNYGNLVVEAGATYQGPLFALDAQLWGAHLGVAMHDLGHTGLTLGFRWGVLTSVTDNDASPTGTDSIRYPYTMFNAEFAPKGDLAF